MKNEFIVNIIHRPEMMPEYAAKANGGKGNEVIAESLDIFLFQQEVAHKNGLKTTIQTELHHTAVLLQTATAKAFMLHKWRLIIQYFAITTHTERLYLTAELCITTETSISEIQALRIIMFTGMTQ